jgi:uncharacterized membrane protein YcjF (UPF0283 family)
MGPILLEPRAEAETRIDQAWQPVALQPPRAKRGPGFWVGSGAALLFATWLGTDLYQLIASGFQDNWFRGGLTAALLGAAGLLAAIGIGKEARNLTRLRAATTLRAALGNPLAPYPPLQAEALAWAREVAPRLPNAPAALEAISACQDRDQLLASLRLHIATPLRDQARGIGLRAAIEGGALVAITPTEPLEGAVAALRGLMVLRRVAMLYGVHPGPVALWSLGKRIAWTAAAVAGTDLFVQTLTDQALSQTPGLRHLAHASGMSIAAFRLYRLALVTAEACSPIPLP